MFPFRWRRPLNESFNIHFDVNFHPLALANLIFQRANLLTSLLLREFIETIITNLGKVFFSLSLASRDSQGKRKRNLIYLIRDFSTKRFPCCGGKNLFSVLIVSSPLKFLIEFSSVLSGKKSSSSLLVEWKGVTLQNEW